MTEPLEMPEDMTKNTLVLFVKPYTAEEAEELRRSGNDSSVLKDIFARSQARDPGSEQFTNFAATVKTYFGLKGYIASEDLILLYGDENELNRAKATLEQKYTCFFDTMGNFMEHAVQEGNVVRTESKKPRLN